MKVVEKWLKKIKFQKFKLKFRKVLSKKIKTKITYQSNLKTFSTWNKFNSRVGLCLGKSFESRSNENYERKMFVTFSMANNFPLSFSTLLLTFCLSMALAIVSMSPTAILCCFNISRFSVSQSEILRKGRWRRKRIMFHVFFFSWED